MRHLVIRLDSLLYYYLNTMQPGNWHEVRSDDDFDIWQEDTKQISENLLIKLIIFKFDSLKFLKSNVMCWVHLHFSVPVGFFLISPHFIPGSKDRHFRLIGDATPKFPLIIIFWKTEASSYLGKAGRPLQELWFCGSHVSAAATAGQGPFFNQGSVSLTAT